MEEVKIQEEEKQVAEKGKTEKILGLENISVFKIIIKQIIRK